MNKRLEFSDKQKAEIFKMDKALCGFTGKSLWVLDYDLCPTYDIDWVDHIKPAMKGGDNSIENGVCTSSFFNAKKRDNSHDNLYFFLRGKPTSYFYNFHEILPDSIQNHIERFHKIEISDWYLNRAFSMFMIGLEYLYDPYLKNGKKQKRDNLYYAKACYKRIGEWKKLEITESILSLEERNMLPEKIGKGQEILLSLRNVNSLEETLSLLEEAFPFYKNNTDVFSDFLQKKLLDKDCLKNISPRMQKIIMQKK